MGKNILIQSQDVILYIIRMNDLHDDFFLIKLMLSERSQTHKSTYKTRQS